MVIIDYMKSIVAGIIDNVLVFLTATFFSIAVASYFTSDYKVILASSIAAAVCITALIDMFREKRKPLENPQIKEVLTQFIYSDESFAHDFIRDALAKRYKVQDMGKYILVNGVTAVFTYLKPQKISAKDVAYIYGNARTVAKKIVVLSVDGADADCNKVLSVLPSPEIHIFDGEKTFRLLQTLNALPETELVLRRNKASVAEFFRACVSPPRARRYFFVSLVLLFSSFFMPRSIYYVVFASVCIVLGIASKLNIVAKISEKRTGVQPR